ncbi:hypothetical protein O7602_13175 [Micromonospora sp. WMMD1128]|uniref:hypothetical protein n=1 Tax=Micromonospora sp. WMMD1128 TaxID=3015150 RepID=UPI00248AD7B1|nr:hypothetical protein [Micromonospora sp. WMMD1128]WBB76420.1 hypothetical protein O7602_13175 [Micromonospora sp. WMMD1128]
MNSGHLRRGSWRASAGLVSTVVALTLTTTPASAAGPFVFNNNGSAVIAGCHAASGCVPGSTLTLNNNQPVGMTCWFDGVEATGNYKSSRWFQIGAVPYRYQWIVHSSYVYNQASVGHC